MCAIICLHVVEIKCMERDGNQDTMQTTTAQKKAIDHYYKELAAYHENKVTHETAVRSAFQNLLSTFGVCQIFCVMCTACLESQMWFLWMQKVHCFERA